MLLWLTYKYLHSLLNLNSINISKVGSIIQGCDIFTNFGINRWQYPKYPSDDSISFAFSYSEKFLMHLISEGFALRMWPKYTTSFLRNSQLLESIWSKHTYTYIRNVGNENDKLIVPNKNCFFLCRQKCKGRKIVSMKTENRKQKL